MLIPKPLSETIKNIKVAMVTYNTPIQVPNGKYWEIKNIFSNYTNIVLLVDGNQSMSTGNTAYTNNLLDNFFIGAGSVLTSSNSSYYIRVSYYEHDL